MNRPDSYDDQQLLSLWRSSGDSVWLGQLLQRYTGLLYGLCLKYLKNAPEAEDAVQQIFVKVITEAGKYEIAFFKSWLYTVARNHCLMQLRGKVYFEDEEKAGATRDESMISELAEKERRLVQLESAVTQLNTEQQQCIRAFYLEKRSYNEISELTGFTVMQVKSHIQNGKRNLRIHLEKKRGYE